MQATQATGGKVFAGDIDGLAPTLYLADCPVQTPKVNDEQFIPKLLEIVTDKDISLVVPTIDYDLPILASFREEFAKRNCRLLVSSRELVDICSDKWKTMEVFRAKGFAVPRSWLPDKLNLEDLPDSLFIKPRNGSASQNTFSVNKLELKQILSFVPNPIIQENIAAKEITVDALLDLNGRLIHYVPRLRIRAVGGESIQGLTISDREIRAWLVEILKEIGRLGGQGPITLQAFLTEDGPLLSEINPRFGGGIPLTLAAGGHYPAWILEMVAGRQVPPKIGEYKVGLYMSRHYVEIFSEEPFF
jgi:carbamoyl-phosphate synthase large subunit